MNRGILFAGFLVACGGSGDTAPPTPPPAVLKQISVSPPSASIVSGESVQAFVTGVDQRGQPMTVTSPSWSSSNSTVATVSGAGLVAALRVGSATITASSSGLSASIAITVSSGTASQLVVTRAATGAVNGGILETQPTVELRDAAGNVASVATRLPVSIEATGGTLTGTTVQNTADGTARFSGVGVRGTTGNTVVLTYRSGTLPPATQSLVILPFSFGNGTRLVGSEIPAGRYRSVNASTALCYWARLRNTTGANNIIANDIGGGPRLMELLPTDVAVESSGCGAWREVVGAVTTSPTTPFTDGVYLVGVDIQPGTWRSNGAGTGCYWARLRNLRGEDEIIANSFGSAPAVVTVLASDVALDVSGCGTWSRLP